MPCWVVLKSEIGQGMDDAYLENETLANPFFPSLYILQTVRGLYAVRVRMKDAMRKCAIINGLPTNWTAARNLRLLENAILSYLVALP